MNFKFPPIRRVFTPSIINSLISIQPMSMPNGSIFYPDYVYGGGENSVEYIMKEIQECENIKKYIIDYVKNKNKYDNLKRALNNTFWENYIDKLAVLK